MSDTATYVKPPPQVNLCTSCGNAGFGDGVWYCASKASREVDPEECLPIAKMFEYRLCGPSVQWRQWEQKR